MHPESRAVRRKKKKEHHMSSTPTKSDADWKRELTPEQYRVLREAGTEAPFSGKLLHNKEAGTYSCGACGAPLFKSETKFDSGCGWPSFYEPPTPDAGGLLVDDNLG